MSKMRLVPARRETPAHKRKLMVDRYVRLGLIVVGAIVVGLLAYGAYHVLVAVPNSPVAIVNGHKITTREYQARVRYGRLNIQAQILSIQQQLSSLDTSDSTASLIQQIYQQQLSSLQSSAASLPLQTLEDMIDEELVRQEASRRGLVASGAEVEHETENWFGYNLDTPTPAPTLEPTPTPEATTPTTEPTIEPTATPTEAGMAEATPVDSPTYTVLLGGTVIAEGTPAATDTPGPTSTPYPTATPMTEEGYQALRDDYLAYIAKAAGVTAEHFSNMMEVRVLEEKLESLLKAEVPSSAPQVHVRQILVSTQAEADEVVARLNAGEDFAAVARELSLDPSAVDDGDVGWASEWDSALDSIVYMQATEMAIGELTVVASSDGYHVVELIEKSDDRALSEYALSQRQSGALDAWLEEQSQSDAVKRYWSSDKVPAETSGY